jgi:hypothetical protein
MKGAWPAGESVGTNSNNEQLKSSLVENKSSPVDPSEDKNLENLQSSLKDNLDQIQQSVKKRNHEHREQLEQFRTHLNQQTPNATSLDYGPGNPALLSGRTHHNINYSQNIAY